MHQSRLKDLHLAVLCKASTVKTFGFKEVLTPFLRDIKILESSGVTVTFQDTSKTFFGTISMLVADNLVAHAIGGYYQNFSTVQRFCRFCNRTKNDISNHNTCGLIRSPEAYDAQVVEVEKANELSSLYEIKERSILNELSFFHISEGAPGDLAHDVFEGFAVDFLTYILIIIIQRKVATLNDINDVIIDFPYKGTHKQNKPQIIKDKPIQKIKVKLTACEMWNFILLFPIMFADFVEDENLWSLYLRFHKLIQHLCAPRFREEDIQCLETCIKSFLKDYSEVTKLPIKPKGHFLLHYPMNLIKFGPLVKTLRFESKHGYFKTSINASKNRVNVCKSMAKHHQMMMYLVNKNEYYFNQEEYDVKGSRESDITLVPDDIKNAIEEKCQLLSDKVIEGDSITCKGCKYSCGAAVILNRKDDDDQGFVFGEIISVFLINNVPYLLCCEMDTVEYIEKLNAYLIKYTEKNLFVSIQELVDYHPLEIYEKQ